MRRSPTTLAISNHRSRTRTVRGAIVCGTDFSDRARQAGNVAAGLAHALDLPLLLVHAAQNSRYGKVTQAARTHPALGELRREAARLRTRGVRVTEELHYGNADEVLVEKAKASGARLIVVASIGMRKESRWRLGSVSERTAQSSLVPTIIVRSDAPFEAWLEQRRPLRVFVAFDFTVTAEAALEWVRTLRDAGPCDVTVAYTNQPPEARDRLGLYEGHDEADNSPTVQEILERDLRGRLRQLLGDTDAEVQVRLNRGHAAHTMMEMATMGQADLIVTGTRQVRGVTRVWQTSMSRNLLHYARESVVCVPLTAAARRVPGIPAMRRVLVTTDFSPVGNRAIAHAFAVTQPGGVVRLVHVVHPRAIAGGQFEKRLRTTARHTSHVQALGVQLQDLLPREADGLGIAAEAKVVECEHTAQGICQEAERFGADAIVIGSRGLSGIQRTLLGSVTQAVMNHSKRPVLVARFPEK